MKALLLVNPSSGGGRGRRLAPRLRRLLTRPGLELQVAVTASAAEAAGAARGYLASGGNRVIAAGGDGTINSLLPALLDSPAALACIPTGTSNGLARELGLPLSIEEACRLAGEGQPRRIDIGLAGNRCFALMAGIGFDAEVVHRVTGRAKSRLGPWAYVFKGLEMLARREPSRFELQLADRTHHFGAWMVLVANAATYTYHWKLTPQARLDDGLLDICVFGDLGPLAALGQVVAALAGSHLRRPGVVCLRAHRAHVIADPPVAVQVDGDPAGFTPVQLDLRPRALAVVAPEPPPASGGEP